MCNTCDTYYLYCPCCQKEERSACEQCGEAAGQYDTILGLLCEDCYDLAVAEGYLPKSKTIYELDL